MKEVQVRGAVDSRGMQRVKARVQMIAYYGSSRRTVSAWQYRHQQRPTAPPRTEPATARRRPFPGMSVWLPAGVAKIPTVPTNRSGPIPPICVFA
ncbi:hypothetical protein AVEN_62599-1 [Araneus ventricosus]|uniref:Uncharacterized protein n=1 Tax=Araneus ventricosus TaxID=182803 RepID=A0A4Y2U5M1_ARAVE|nr:hypothetical protein AVEN_62599-1 [Araneus ventricosus]